MGWNLKQWKALPESEQELWLDYEAYRRRKTIDAMLGLQQNEVNTPEAMTLLRIEYGLSNLDLYTPSE